MANIMRRHQIFRHNPKGAVMMQNLVKSQSIQQLNTHPLKHRDLVEKIQ